ncbi:DUF3145 family protein [Mycetocola spongiae]|uniref:DUF3145 family protein n=1 Tax=Mycetocola spongiae TaxID=2859226 RepID=UPI001CF150B6|nr:DUF3145 family protein [Mycetocola spongiae]
MQKPVRGMIFIHSAPRALRAHIDWAVGGVLECALNLPWIAQPILPHAVRAEYAWEGPAGTGARLASALHEWPQARFEVVEESSPWQDGGRWMFTPSRGMHAAQTNRAGDIVLDENLLRLALAESQSAPAGLAERLRGLLGAGWDEELEVFRSAGDLGNLAWLHGVG